MITHISDGLSAAVAAWAVVLGEARHAVDSAVVLVELGRVYRLVARVASEVLRVPFLVQRCHDLEMNNNLGLVLSEAIKKLEWIGQAECLFVAFIGTK